MFSDKKLKVYFLYFVMISFLFAQNRAKLDTITFNDLSGKKVSLEKYKGKITIVNFWATWSAACLKEMPKLEKIYKEFTQDQVEVVGVAVMSDTGKIKKMLDITRVTYPILVGTRQDMQKISTTLTIPQTIILNRQGKIVARFGGEQNYKTYYQLIMKHIDHSQLSENNQSTLKYIKD